MLNLWELGVEIIYVVERSHESSQLHSYEPRMMFVFLNTLYNFIIAHVFNDALMLLKSRWLFKKSDHIH